MKPNKKTEPQQYRAWKAREREEITYALYRDLREKLPADVAEIVLLGVVLPQARSWLRSRVHGRRRDLFKLDVEALNRRYRAEKVERDRYLRSRGAGPWRKGLQVGHPGLGKRR